MYSKMMRSSMNLRWASGVDPAARSEATKRFRSPLKSRRMVSSMSASIYEDGRRAVLARKSAMTRRRSAMELRVSSAAAATALSNSASVLVPARICPMIGSIWRRMSEVVMPLPSASAAIRSTCISDQRLAAASSKVSCLSWADPTDAVRTSRLERRKDFIGRWERAAVRGSLGFPSVSAGGLVRSSGETDCRRE